MTDERLQKVSAFIDGECSSGETEHIIDQALTDDAARGAWTRYHFIGNVMRGELPRYLLRDFVGRVRNSIGPDPVVPALLARQRVWLKPVSGLAMAASVALVAIVAVRQFGETAPPAGGTPQVAAATIPTIPSIPAARATAPPLRAAVPAASQTPVRPLEMPLLLEDWHQVEELYPAATLSPASPSWSRLNRYLVNYSEQRATLGSPSMLSYVKVVGYGQEQ